MHHTPSPVNEPNSPNWAPGNFHPRCAQSRPVHRSSKRTSFSSAELRAVHRNGLVTQRLHSLPHVPRAGQYPEIELLWLPFHGNGQRHNIRDNSPSGWADVVAFDTAIRKGNARANATGNRLLGEAFL